MAKHPLCTIGVHTLTHPRLAKHDEDFARRELSESRKIIEAHIGKDARHLAYPVGDPSSAGAREFKLAEELGFASAVTTRPGMIFPQHQTQLMALPRLSINGNWQSLDAVEIFLSGAPFALVEFDAQGGVTALILQRSVLPLARRVSKDGPRSSTSRTTSRL